MKRISGKAEKGKTAREGGREATSEKPNIKIRKCLLRIMCKSSFENDGEMMKMK